MTTIIRRVRANNYIGKQYEIEKDSWDLDYQINKSMAWINENSNLIINGKWVLDIGFCMRKKVIVSGYTINVDVMKRLSRLKIDLWISQYPGKC